MEEFLPGQEYEFGDSPREMGTSGNLKGEFVIVLKTLTSHVYNRRLVSLVSAVYEHIGLTTDGRFLKRKI